jgi:hypothetical protein
MAGLCENRSFAPLGLVWFRLFPTARAVGCILTPPCGSEALSTVLPELSRTQG